MAALESVGIATNLLTMDDNGLDVSCQIPTLPLTSKQREDIRAGSSFTWEMSFETINIQVKSGSSSVKTRDLIGWDMANKSSPLGARIMVVWLEHKEPDVIWVFDPGAISSIVEGLSVDQASVTLSAKAHKSAAVEIDCTKLEVLGRYLWFWSNCPVALAEVWEKDILELAQNPTWPNFEELEKIAYAFFLWECHKEEFGSVQALYNQKDHDSRAVGDVFLECRKLIRPFYEMGRFSECLDDRDEAARTVIDLLSVEGAVWEDREKDKYEGPANLGWSPPAAQRDLVVKQFMTLFDFLLSENE